MFKEDFPPSLHTLLALKTQTCQTKETNRRMVQGKSVFTIRTPDLKYFIHDELDNLK